MRLDNLIQGGVMNRAVYHCLKDASHETFGNAIIQAIRRSPVAYEKNAEFHLNNPNDPRIPHPMELAKYGFRIYPWLELNGESVSLIDMQQRDDPYEPTKFWMFCGQFTYSKEDGGYVPLGTKVYKTKWFKQIYKE